MALSKYIPTTRVSPEKITLRNRQFAQLLAKRTGVSMDALNKAIQLISDGIIDVLAEGYDVHFNGIGTFQTRELPPRRRYHRLNKTVYISEPSTIVHFHKAENLTNRVRKLASEKLGKLADKSHVVTPK